MSADNNGSEKGFSITPARVAFIGSLLALGTFGYNMAAASVKQDMKLQAHDEYIVEDKQITKETLTELKDLNKKVDRLTFLMEGTKSTDLGSLRK